jgi:predicted amidophosphoribosyltransferase
MWWECSECGDQIERTRAPKRCRECGMPGVFARVDVDEPIAGVPEADGLRAVWLRRGLEHGVARAV